MFKDIPTFQSRKLDRLAALDEQGFRDLGFRVRDKPIVYEGMLHHKSFVASLSNELIVVEVTQPCALKERYFRVRSKNDSLDCWIVWDEKSIVADFNQRHPCGKQITSLEDLAEMDYDITDDHEECVEATTVVIKFRGHSFVIDLGETVIITAGKTAIEREAWSVYTEYGPVDMHRLYDRSRVEELKDLLEYAVGGLFSPIDLWAQQSTL